MHKFNAKYPSIQIHFGHRLDAMHVVITGKLQRTTWTDSHHKSCIMLLLHNRRFYLNKLTHIFNGKLYKHTDRCACFHRQWHCAKYRAKCPPNVPCKCAVPSAVEMCRGNAL